MDTRQRRRRWSVTAQLQLCGLLVCLFTFSLLAESALAHDALFEVESVAQPPRLTCASAGNGNRRCEGTLIASCEYQAIIYVGPCRPQQQYEAEIWSACLTQLRGLSCGGSNANEIPQDATCTTGRPTESHRISCHEYQDGSRTYHAIVGASYCTLPCMRYTPSQIINF